MNGDRYSHSTYLIRRKILRILGGAFHIYGSDGQLLFYSEMKRMKLREDIRIYSNESMAKEVLAIKARTMLDISTTYDVVDSATGERVGALKRSGLKSVLRDEWQVLNTSDQPVAFIREDSLMFALLRRFLSNLIPQSYQCEVNGRTVASFHQNFNPLVLKITLDFSADRAGSLDRRLGLAAGILLTAIEGRQG